MKYLSGKLRMVVIAIAAIISLSAAATENTTFQPFPTAARQLRQGNHDCSKEAIAQRDVGNRDFPRHDARC